MWERIYQLPGKNAIVFPDATVLKAYDPESAKLLRVNSDRVLFPEAANHLDAAQELNAALREVREVSLSHGDGYYGWRDHLWRVDKFGIQPGAEDVVRHIMRKYADVCREKERNGEVFNPGLQYSFFGQANDGVEVTLGDYGLFFATLIAASGDHMFKDYLISEGERLLGSRAAFFVNPVATNTVVECDDGLLFVRRGKTAEYSHMLHQVAAGHHGVKGPGMVIPLRDLVSRQIVTETGVGDEMVSGVRLNGTAFSTGYALPSTEKSEILTYARIGMSSEDVWRSIREKADHKWETMQLFCVPREHAGEVIRGTFDSSRPVPKMEHVKTYSMQGDDTEIGKDSVRSSSHWVPVGLANLAVETGHKSYPAKNPPAGETAGAPPEKSPGFFRRNYQDAVCWGVGLSILAGGLAQYIGGKIGKKDHPYRSIPAMSASGPAGAGLPDEDFSDVDLGGKRWNFKQNSKDWVPFSVEIEGTDAVITCPPGYRGIVGVKPDGGGKWKTGNPGKPIEKGSGACQVLIGNLDGDNLDIDGSVRSINGL